MNSLVFLNYRAGSTFWRFITKGRQDEKQKVPGIHERCYYLPTLPEGLCPCANYELVPIEQNRVENGPFCWFALVGDWWGQCSGNKVPSPYDPPECSTRWDANALAELSGDWKFIYLIRDGRNQAASFWNRREGTTEWKRRLKDPDDYFLFLCKSWRNRARVAIDNQRRIKDYKIFKFEDFVSSPIETLSKMIEHLGYEPDKQRITESVEFATQSGRVHKHSSFGNGSFNERWRGWTHVQKKTFMSIAELELRELGYSLE
jgi:hypothetical protein